MRREHLRAEDKEILLEKKLDAKVDKKYNKELEKAKKELEKAKKRKNSKFRNSKFGTRWFGMAKWKRVTIYVVLAVLLLALIGILTVYGIYNNFRNGVKEENLGISSEIEDKYGKTDIFNVAVFGVDTRDKEAFTGRSDSIMIVSIDKKNNTVKISSILRDSYVAIEGHKNQKITHAYMFGGAELAIKTLNQNFAMNITDYVTLNFYKLGEAIDVLGGVDLEVTERERKHLNDIGDDENDNFGYLQESGYVHLTGEQAVVYARLRKIDSDEARANRQKKVAEALLEQARKVSPSKYAELLRTMLSFCETSLSFNEIMSFAPMVTADLNIQMTNVPNEEDNAIGGMYEGAWVWRYDLTEAAERLHLFIYGEVPETTTKKSPWNSGKKEPNTTTKPASKTTVPVTEKPKPGVPVTQTEPAVTVPEDATKPVTEPGTVPGSEPGTQPPQTEPGTRPPQTEPDTKPEIPGTTAAAA